MTASRVLPRLHAVMDDRIAALPNVEELARAIATSSQVAVHLRAPAFPGRRFFELAERLKAALAPSGALLFINDRVDVALGCGAAGVHLPGHGLPVAAARRLLGAECFIGRSVHAAGEATGAAAAPSLPSPAAEAGGAAEGGGAGEAAGAADYVFLGPIWQTASHPGRPPLGVEAIAAAQPARVIAIGGITPERAAECRKAGAYGVAAIRALWDARDPGAAAREMLLSLESE